MGWINSVILIIFFSRAYGTGEISILQSPESISFTGQEVLDLSNVPNVLSTVLGFTSPEGPRWSGLTLKDPFHFADAIVVVSVHGIDSVDSSQGHTFPLNTDVALDDLYHTVDYRLTERYPIVTNLTSLYLKLKNRNEVENKIGELTLKDMPATQHLDPTLPEDRTFLEQMQVLDALTTKLCSRMCNDKKDKVVTDGIPDIYWIVVEDLDKLQQTYGSESKQMEEARKMLTSSILLLSEVYNTGYDYQVVCAVISSDVVHLPRYRRDTNTNNTSPPSNQRVSESNSNEDFPAIFNIFLWFNIALVFVLIAVCYGIATMDPGRDSIIYRMTSNRMKKDN